MSTTVGRSVRLTDPTLRSVASACTVGRIFWSRRQINDADLVCEAVARSEPYVAPNLLEGRMPLRRRHAVGPNRIVDNQHPDKPGRNPCLLVHPPQVRE